MQLYRLFWQMHTHHWFRTLRDQNTRLWTKQAQIKDSKDFLVYYIYSFLADYLFDRPQ